MRDVLLCLSVILAMSAVLICLAEGLLWWALGALLVGCWVLWEMR